MNQTTYKSPPIGGLAITIFLLSIATNTKAFFIALPDILRQGVVLSTIKSPVQQDNQVLLIIAGSAIHPVSNNTTAFVAQITKDDLLDSRFGSGGLVWLQQEDESFSQATDINLLFDKYHISVTSKSSQEYTTTTVYVLDLLGSLIAQY